MAQTLSAAGGGAARKPILPNHTQSVRSRVTRHWQLYIFLLIPLVFLGAFKYAPMFGLQIAFRDYNIGLGVWGSRWVGMKYFRTFINSFEFPRLLRNTLAIGVYSLLVGLPCQIILALSINACRGRVLSKAAQMVTYAPYFISSVILVTIVMQFLAVRGGMLNNVRAMLGMQPINLMARPGAFRHIYVWSGVWQETGYGAVIYIAALAGVNPELYEAATIDGASVLQRIWHIDMPSIMPVAVILLIMKCGGIINVGHEKVL
ncbi:MAG: ABC transporter permease subunit, partial [Oscillospiraceae bacterium]|nr:ABC transporter permease subunit [Oscillospiraceae bacterium]